MSKMKRLCPGDKVRLRRGWSIVKKGAEGIIETANLSSGYSVLGIGAWLDDDDLELVREKDASTMLEAERMEEESDDEIHERC